MGIDKIRRGIMDSITENNANEIGLEEEEQVEQDLLAEYTPEEQQDIFLAPFYSYYLTSAVDGGIIAAAREFDAFDRAMVDSLEQLKGNKLIEAAFWNLDSDAKRKETHQKIKSEGKSFDDVKEEYMAVIVRAIATVTQKASKKDAGEYLYFVHDIAERVAYASGEGFLGTGEKLSPKEKAFLDELRTALGIGNEF
jgi:hypothetical protein